MTDSKVLKRKEINNEEVDVDFEGSADEWIDIEENDDAYCASNLTSINSKTESQIRESSMRNSSETDSIEKKNTDSNAKKKRKRKRKKKKDNAEILEEPYKDAKKAQAQMSQLFATMARSFIQEKYPDLNDKGFDRMMEGTPPLADNKPRYAQFNQIVRRLYLKWRPYLFKFSLPRLTNAIWLTNFIREVVVAGHWREAIMDELHKAKVFSIDEDIVARYKKSFPFGGYESNRPLALPFSNAKDSGRSIESSSTPKETEMQPDSALDVVASNSVVESLLEDVNVEIPEATPLSMETSSAISTVINDMDSYVLSSDWENRYNNRLIPTTLDVCYSMTISNKVLSFVKYSQFLLPKSGLPSFFYFCEHCPPPGTIEMIKTPQEYRRHYWNATKKSIWPQKRHHTEDVVFIISGLHLSGRTSVMRQIHRILTTFPPFYDQVETDVYQVSIPVYKKYEEVSDPMKPEIAAMHKILHTRQRFTPRFAVEVRMHSLGKITLITSKDTWIVIFGEYMANASQQNPAKREGVDGFTFNPFEVRKRISVVLSSIYTERNTNCPSARIFYFMEGNAVQSTDFLQSWQPEINVEPIVIHLAASNEAISSRINNILAKFPFKSYSIGSRNAEVEEQILHLEEWCDEYNLCFLQQKAETFDDLKEVVHGLMTFILTDEDGNFYDTWTKPNAM